MMNPGPRILARLSVLALAVATIGLVASVHAQPFPSFLLDTGYVVGPDQTGAANPALAIGDSTGLVVWNSHGHVKGCLTTSGRTSPSTACIDISGPNEIFSTEPLDVGKSPNGYLVVWPGEMVRTLRGAVVSLNGEVVMRETLVYYPQRFPMANPAVAFDGINYLVAWDEEHWTTRWVMCTRVSQAGQVLDWPPIKVCPAGDGQSYVSLSYGDSCYLAAYWHWVPGKSDYGIWCSRILPTGVVLDSAGIPVRHWSDGIRDSRTGNTAVAFDGQNFVVGWFEQKSPFEVRAARVTQSGVVLDPEGLTVSTTPEAPSLVTAASVSDTTLLVWTRHWNDTVAVSGRRLSAAGELLDTLDIFITQPFRAVHSYLGPRAGSVSRCGDGFQVVYRNFVISSGALYGAREVLDRRVSAAGQVLDTVGTLLSYAANYQTAADVASDGQDYLAVWTDLRAGLSTHDCAVYGMRFSNEGRALDPSSFRISQWGSHAPRVAYGAGCYLVSWLTDFGEDSSQVWAARIGGDGVPLDTNPIRIPGLVFDCRYGDPDVAFGDSLFLVVWHYGGTGCAEAARVSADGILLDSTPIRLETSHGGVNRYPRVASDGHDFLAVWEDWLRLHVYGLRVGSSGEVLDSMPIDIGGFGNADFPPYVTYGAGVYLVVEPSSADKAWRVTPDGVVLDTIHLDPGLHYPEVTYDGTNFFLVEPGVWTNGLSHGYLAIRISPQGEVLDSLKLNIIDLRPEGTYVSNEIGFGLTADLRGHVGMAFPAFQSNPYVSRRIRAAAFPAVPPGVEETPSVEVRATKSGPTVVRGILYLPLASGVEHRASSVLLDVTGRKVLDLRPGANDVRALPPGVYFVREEMQATSHKPQAIRKVVVTR